MDCSSARLFLHFNRPGAHELDGPDAEELNLHLAHCTECNALARADRRLDQHLGRAMRAVEVPPGLRGEILHRLAAERGDWHRRWLAHVGRGVAAALLLIAVVWGSFALYARTRQGIAADEVAFACNVTPPGRPEVNQALKRLGDEPQAPDFVNYAYLTGAPALAELPGYPKVKAPQLVFTRKSTDREEKKAVIFILNNKQFRIDDLETSTSGYHFHLEVYRPNPAGPCTYLVLYTGNNWDWLKVADPAE